MLLFERIISLISPDECLACNEEGSVFCDACREAEIVAPASSCYHCGDITKDFATCLKCKNRSPLSHVWVASSYESFPRGLIHDFKFKAHRSAVTPIAEMCVATLPFLEGFIITHVPSSPPRIRERSFDHAKLLASRISRLQHLPHFSLLRRVKNVRQTGASKAERLRHMDGAFVSKSEYVIKGAKILLVDDVMTTGASLEEAARVLKMAGAKEICAVVFAR